MKIELNDQEANLVLQALGDLVAQVLQQHVADPGGHLAQGLQDEVHFLFGQFQTHVIYSRESQAERWPGGR